MFLAMNRNKLGMTLDPAAPKGREIVRKLVATADVVVANLPPAVLRSLELDLDCLRRTKPDIILTTVTGFGAGGPFAQARFRRHRPGDERRASTCPAFPEQPIACKVPWVDFGTACLSAFGTMAALSNAARPGSGPEGRGRPAAHRDRLRQLAADRAGADRGEPRRDGQSRLQLGAGRLFPHQGRLDRRDRDRPADVPALVPHGRRGAFSRRPALRRRPGARRSRRDRSRRG